jgi:peptide-methionine (S)-S-oxide reductase
MSTGIATFGAGCFWGVEARFRELPGVTDVTVGYMGGELPDPTYRDVCTGRTGHAEVAQVRFDEDRVGYEALLDRFFEIHDPTTPNRQGPDVGSQYRSVIFTHDGRQAEAAQYKLRSLAAERRYARPVVTRVEPAREFWRAEEYHQRYLEKNSGTRCHV